MTKTSLETLGFDPSFFKHEQINQGFVIARVISEDKERYLIRTQTAEVEAQVIGRMMFENTKREDFPAVGDWVLATLYDDETLAIIQYLLPRKNSLKRKTAGNNVDYQIIGTNIDTAFIIQSLDYDLNTNRLERYLVMIKNAGIKPFILLSKSDLFSENEINEKLEQIKSDIRNIPILYYSAQTGQGLDQVLAQLLPQKTYCFIGSSGVGKTTLLNRILGGDFYKTTEVRLDDGKGKHTTTRRHLILTEKHGMIIDTPGMRELGNFDVKEGLDLTFSEIAYYARQCKFKDCSHTSEPGCAVIEAVKEEKISRRYYKNYLKLKKENEHYEMSYEEKRKKDKSQGKFYKRAMKDMQEFKYKGFSK